MNAATNNLREDRDWVKVSELSVGMQIAVPKAACFDAFAVARPAADLAEVDAGDVLWDEIEEIRELPEEQVWDIEVEGTHNFVAGHLHPHADIDTDVESVPASPRPLTEEEEKAWLYKHGMRDVVGDNGTGSTEKQCRYGGVFAHNTYLDGDVGIGTNSGAAKLSILDQTSELRDVFSVATSTDDSVFRVDTAGDAFARGAFNSGGADYAEHFYADSGDLTPGELVCVSLENENAVARCVRPADGNIMGIVSTNPAIVGNAGNIAAQKASVVVGMLGQVPAKVSGENGPIRPGDSLTSASLPGYAAKAGPGDPTVGVALERMDADTGMVRVLISRRNKSLTVTEVEAAVVDRIAAMEIEDEVALLVSDAVSGYDFDPVVADIIGGELALLEQDFDLRLTDEIAALRALIDANKLEMIEESADMVAINTNLTVAGELEASGGILVPLDFPLLYSGGGQGVVPSSTPPAFKVATDGTVTAYSDFIISDGVTATSVRDTLAKLTAPEMTKTKLTVTQDLYVGNSFEVMGGQVAGAAVKRPVFKIAADGTVSVREDLVLSGYTQWNDIPGIVSVFAYNTANDLDGGAWVAGARSASWYTEAIDATADSCDVGVNDRCGLRSFPQHAVIAATSDTIYIFNAQDGSLWKKITNFGGEALAGITALHAADGSIYLAQGNTISIIDLKNDGIASVGSTLTRNDTITGIHARKINGKTRLAVSGDKGVDLIDLSEETSAHYAGPASNARLTAAGDLWATATSTVSVFTRAYNQAELAPSETYTASSTLQGLYVAKDGNTAYTASGSDILVFTLDRHPELVSELALNSIQGSVLNQKQILKQVQNDGSVSLDTITSFTVDEQARVIYAAYAGGVKALALGDGSVLATYESGETSWGAPWALAGAVQVASLTLGGPVREGELFSDTLVIATPQGLLAKAGDYSLRRALASGLSGGNALSKQRSALSVSDEALFSGRVMVTDGQRLPVFAIDEHTGNTIVREDIVFSADARLASVPNASAVFVYDTAQDSDGGQWSKAFPRKSVLVAAGNKVSIYDSRTKERWGTYESSGISSIAGLAAKNGALALYGDEGLALVDLASGEEGEILSLGGYASLQNDGVDVEAAAAITAIAFDRDGELYYATADAVYSIDRHAGGVLADSISVADKILSLAEYGSLQNDGKITGIAFIKNNLYIANEDGITKVDLITQETEPITISDEAGFAVHAAPITSISTATHNTLLVAYGDKVAEITESGDIINTWTSEQNKKDRNNLPYLASSVSGASAADGAYAIAVQTPSGDSFVWMQTQEQSLRDMLNAPRNVFTVIDRIQTPRITSVSPLSFTASSTISFYAGATSTPALVIRDNGDISTSGKVGIGTTTPEFMLDVAGDSRFSSVTAETIRTTSMATSTFSGDLAVSGATKLATTTASELSVTNGYFQLNTSPGAPAAEDCDSEDEYGRMAFDAQSETLYLCGPAGFRAFTAAGPAAGE